MLLFLLYFDIHMQKGADYPCAGRRWNGCGMNLVGRISLFNLNAACMRDLSTPCGISPRLTNSTTVDAGFGHEDEHDLLLTYQRLELISESLHHVNGRVCDSHNTPYIPSYQIYFQKLLATRIPNSIK